MKKLEQVAAYLIKNNVPFHFSDNQIVVTDKDYILFSEACYHAKTKELILLDFNFKKVEICKLSLN